MSDCIGYLRYSSEVQGSGSSLQRQRGLINAWVNEQREKHGKDYTIVWYQDLGVSGWDGSNRDKGALGRLIGDIEAGVFPPDTPMIVESADRISRGDLQEAQAILRDITKHGIVIHAITDRQTITFDSLRKIEGVIRIILTAERAREESNIKSERVSDAKARAREKALKGEGIVTKNLPGWITYNEDTKQLLLIPEKVALIQEIYEMRLRGMQFQAIANILNDRQEPILNSKRGAQHWLANSVRTLLHNKAVIGYLAPSKVNKKFTAIENYFPAAITNNLFDSVQEMNVPAVKGVAKNSAEKKTYPESVYLFKKLVKCKYCHGNVFPNGAKPGYWGRVRCMGHHNKTCEAPPTSRYDFEYSLVTRMFPLLKQINVTKGEDPAVSIKLRVEHLESEIQNLSEVVAALGISNARIQLEMIKTKTTELERLTVQLKSYQRKVNLDVSDNLDKLDFNSFEDRLKMQLVIARNVDKIVLDTLYDKCHVRLHNGNVLMNFPLYGDNDVSYTLSRAMQHDTEIDELLGLPDFTPTIYNVRQPKDHSQIDYDALGWPESDEPDYPNVSE